MDLFGDDEVEEKGEVEVSEPFEGLKDAQESCFCKGHEDNEKRLLELFQSGKLPHGLVFSGSRGIGKATMAFRFAKFLLKNGGQSNQDSLFGDEPDFTTMDVDADDPVARQVSSGAHPDLFVVRRVYDATKNTYKESVDVGEVRKIAPFLRMTSSYGGWRVVILDDADTMNRNAQNALLKILEEPPSRTVLILVAHRMGALLPTIRSRVQVMNFNPLPAPVIQELLQMSGHEASEQLLELSEGSMRKAIDYAENEASEILDEILGLYGDGDSPDWSKIHVFSEQTGGRNQRGSYDVFESLVLWMFQQGVKMKARGGAMPLALSKIQPQLQKLSLEQALGICDKLAAHFAQTKKANLDKRQAVFQAFSIMAR